MNPQTTARSAPGRNNIIRFEHGIIERLKIETRTATATETEGNYGPQWLFFCENHQMFYADQKLFDALKRAEYNHPAELERTQSGQPAGFRTQEWEIMKSRQGSKNVYTVTPASDATTEDQPALELNWDDLPAVPAVQRKAQLLRRVTAAEAAAAIPAAVPIATVLKTAAARLLARYIEALEVAELAQREAKAKGMLITATFEDIRCLAATLFIDDRKGS